MLGSHEEEQKSSSVISSNKDTFISNSTNGMLYSTNAPTKSLNLISNTLKSHLANGLSHLNNNEIIANSNSGTAQNILTLKNIISKQIKTNTNQHSNSISMPMTPN